MAGSADDVRCWGEERKLDFGAGRAAFDPTETSDTRHLGQSSTQRWYGHGRARAAITASNATSASSPAAIVKKKPRKSPIPRRPGRKKPDQSGWQPQPHWGLILRID